MTHLVRPKETETYFDILKRVQKYQMKRVFREKLEHPIACDSGSEYVNDINAGRTNIRPRYFLITVLLVDGVHREEISKTDYIQDSEAYEKYIIFLLEEGKILK